MEAIEIYIVLISALIALGTIAEKEKSKVNMLGICFCVCIVVLAVLNLV